MGLIFELGALAAVAGAVVWLCRRMRDSGAGRPPYARLSLVLVTYCSALWFVASALVGSLELAAYVPLFLVLAAPLVMLAVALLTFRERKVSPYHNAAFLGSVAYFCLLFGGFVLLSKSCPTPTGGPP